MPLNYKNYIDAKKKRVVGAILHGIDTKMPTNELKILIKSKLNSFAKDVTELCLAIEGEDILVSPLAEAVRTGVEKANAKR